MPEAGWVLSCFYEEAAGVVERRAVEDFAAVVS
jgi:hypothetical protein